MTRQRAVLLVVLLAALASAVSQTVFEFGLLWLVALHAAGRRPVPGSRC
jgi:hypothetical protein